MHHREASTAHLLVAFLLLSTLLTGCGGEDQTGNGGSQDGAGGQPEQAGEAAQKKGKPAEFKVALGSIGRVDTEDEKFIVRPSTEDQGERLVFKVGKKAKFVQADKKVELANVEKGQQAQVRYLVKNERNIAIYVTLFGVEAAPQQGEESEGGEKTG